MTESDWLTATDARALLRFLYPLRSEGSAPDLDRKLRLYLTACGRRAWASLPAAVRALVEAAERMAEGWNPSTAAYFDLYDAAEALHDCDGEPAELLAATARLIGLGVPVAAAGGRPPAGRWRDFAALGFVPIWKQGPVDNHVRGHLHSAALVREVFHYPQRTLAMHDGWQTQTVRDLAETVYAERAFDRLPILADALQDAACDADELLAHFRDAATEHVRGCWALDLVLGRG